MKPFLVSFGITVLTTPLVIALAHKLGWVARPREDRWHSRPTALMGGIAIVLGAVAAWLVTADMHILRPLILPALCIFVLGAVDDRVRLSAHVKLIGQFVAAGLLLMGGVRFGALPPIVALPLTLFWVVGITNAVNLLDNMDGLAAGVSALSALIMAAYSWSAGITTGIPICLGLAGACIGFLIYNFNPARIFMGDCGSMFIGFTLAAMSVEGTYRSAPNLFLSLFVPVVILAVPIFDTALVSVVRTLHGRSISQGGRDHSSHRLFALGLSERGTVAVLYLLTAAFGSLAVLATRVRLSVLLLVAALLFTCLIVLGLYLGILKVYADDVRVPEKFRRIGGTLMYKKQILQVLLDVPLVGLAFCGAHLLRFDGSLPGPILRGITEAIPVVMAAKLGAMAACRAYRGVWRYAGMADIVRAFAGSTFGSLIAAAVLGLATGFKDYSRSALIIDWLLFTLFATGARTWYVAFRQLFGMLPPRDGPRVVILGADARAVAMAHRLRDPHATVRAEVLGILDDDPDKHGRALDGVSVLGPLSDLRILVEERGVSCCLVCTPLESESAREIFGFCEEHQILVMNDLEMQAWSDSDDLVLR